MLTFLLICWKLIKIMGKWVKHLIILQLQVLMSIRTESAFDQFWDVIALEQQRLDVDDPVMPRKRKVPAWLEEGSRDTYHNPTNVEELYQPLYFESLDLAVAGIKERFNQTEFLQYRNIQQLLINALNDKDFEHEIDAVCNFYGDDFVKDALRSQLLNLRHCSTENISTASGLVKFLQHSFF